MNEIILDRALGFNINRVANLFRRELIRCFCDYNLSPEQWQVLSTLWRKGSLTQVEIITITQQDAPTISRMIQRMEKNGWVKKTPSKSDSRATIIKVTASGKRLKEELITKLVNHFKKFLANYPAEKQDQLLKLLIDLRVALGDEIRDR